MAVRLRPQSSAWLAPTALAAQLTAQTGQIAGQGVAGLLGGIAQGVGAFTQKREQRRVEAINESRYQDNLTRQDRDFGMREKAFTLDLLQGNDRILAESETGKAAELEMALMAGEDASVLKQELEKIRSSRRAVQSNMMGLAPALKAAAAGRAAPDAGPVGPGGWPVGQSPSEKAARGEPTGDPDVFWNAKDYAESDTAQRGGAMPTPPSGPRMAKGGIPVEVPRDGFDLETPAGVAAYAKAHEELADQWDKLAATYAGSKNPMVVARARGFMGTAAEIRMRGLGYQGMAMTKAEKAKPAELEAEGAARKRGELSVTAPAEAAELERVNASNRARGLPEIGSLRQIGPVETTARVNNNREDTQAFTEKRDASKQTFATQRDLARNQAANARQERSIAFKERWNKRKEDIAVKYKDAALAAQATQQEIDNQKVRMQAAESNYVMLRKQYDDGRDPGEAFYGTDTKPSAYDKYQDEMEKYMAMTDDDAPAPSAATATAPAATGGGYPSWLPPEEKAAWDAMPDSEKAKAIEKAGR